MSSECVLIMMCFVCTSVAQLYQLSMFYIIVKWYRLNGKNIDILEKLKI